MRSGDQWSVGAVTRLRSELFVIVPNISFAPLLAKAWATMLLFVCSTHVWSQEVARLEVWSGIDATSHATSIYGGATYAPYGSLSESGLRLRAVTGAGRYRYHAVTGHSGSGRQTIHGETLFADLLLGYHVNFGAMTLKSYLGGTYGDHLLSPGDPANSVSGAEFGVKGTIEAWINFGEQSWMAIDLNATTVHGGYDGRIRLGYRATRQLSFGPEAGAYGNQEFSGGRGGLFIRYEWADGELTLAGGVSGDIAEPTNPHGMLNIVHRF